MGVRGAVAVACATVSLLAAGASGAAPPAAFVGNCQVCHQATGSGIPGQFPRLAGRTNAIAASKDGRDYLIAVLLNGMAGKITVDDRPIIGLMPTYARLSDADIAAVLTHVTTLPPAKKIAPFTAAEVKAARALPRQSSVAMKARREALVAAQVVP